jgi:hypothetical protein
MRRATLDDLVELATCRKRQIRTGKGHHRYLGAVSTTQRVLFHLGVVDRPPRSGDPVPFDERLAEVTAPLRTEFFDYLNRKTATCGAKTVTATATKHKHFNVFVTRTDPTLASVRDLDRRRHIESFLTSLNEAVSEKDGPPISSGDRHRPVRDRGDIPERHR